MQPNLQVLCVLLTEVLLCFASTTDDPSTSWATEIPITLAGMLDSDTNSPTTEIDEGTSEATMGAPTCDSAEYESHMIEEGLAVANPDEAESRIETPKFAGCEPELTTVSLRQSEDYSIVYTPSCTRIERCGGCCVRAAHECAPLEKVNITYRIKMTKYRERSQSLEVQVEKHTKCGCQCIKKPSECNIRQTFITKNCICRCANTEEKQKCEADSEIKLWDNDQCVCKCRNLGSNCPSNTIFNNFTCRCEDERLSLWRT